MPSPSTVMQNVGPVQSMAVKPCAAEMVAGGNQDEPLYVATWFWLGAAAQKVGEAHDRYETPWGDGEGSAGPSEVTLSSSSR